MALRLKYAGVPAERIAVEAEPRRRRSTAALDGGARSVFALPTYTAMLALREVLVARGAARGSFA